MKIYQLYVFDIDIIVYKKLIKLRHDVKKMRIHIKNK